MEAELGGEGESEWIKCGVNAARTGTGAAIGITSGSVTGGELRLGRLSVYGGGGG